MNHRIPEVAAGFLGGVTVAGLAVAALIRSMERQIDHIAGMDEWHNATRRTSFADYCETPQWNDVPREWGDA